MKIKAKIVLKSGKQKKEKEKKRKEKLQQRDNGNKNGLKLAKKQRMMKTYGRKHFEKR